MRNGIETKAPLFSISLLVMPIMFLLMVIIAVASHSIKDAIRDQRDSIEFDCKAMYPDPTRIARQTIARCEYAIASNVRIAHKKIETARKVSIYHPPTTALLSFSCGKPFTPHSNIH